MKAANGSAAVIVLGLLVAGCIVDGAIRPTLDQPTAAQIAGLWQERLETTTLDLFHGPGGEALMPETTAPFTFIKADTTGYSAGYDVRGPDGTEWSVKLGPEAQPEVAVSRILWALGYYQPPTYYLATWTMVGQQSGPQRAGRFRPKLPDWNVVGDWSWYENDFIHTQPFKGLVAANVILNNWDWKTSNNKIYEIPNGESALRIFVVRDLGASLGKTSYPKTLSWLPARGFGQGSRNNLEDFEEQGFIKKVDGERVEFYYRGIHHSLLDLLRTRDVVWICERMSRLSATQWHDAFRAAGYSDDQARRFVVKIRSKVAAGLKLA